MCALSDSKVTTRSSTKHFFLFECVCARAKKNNNAASRVVCVCIELCKTFEFFFCLRRKVSLKKVLCFAAFVCVYLFVLLTDASRRQAGAPLRVCSSAPALFVGVISSNDLLCARAS